jgi:hypothetical protein
MMIERASFGVEAGGEDEDENAIDKTCLRMG